MRPGSLRKYNKIDFREECCFFIIILLLLINRRPRVSIYNIRCYSFFLKFIIYYTGM